DSRAVAADASEPARQDLLRRPGGCQSADDRALHERPDAVRRHLPPLPHEIPARPLALPRSADQDVFAEQTSRSARRRAGREREPAPPGEEEDAGSEETAGVEGLRRTMTALLKP